jgi:hypothetical protein
MSGGVILPTLHAFMTYIGTILPFPHLSYVWRTDYCVHTGHVLDVHLCHAAIFFSKLGFLSKKMRK